MTGTGNPSASSWTTLTPTPEGWKNYRTVQVPGWYRIEAIAPKGSSYLQICAQAGDGQVQEGFGGDARDLVVAHVYLSPTRLFYINHQGDGLPLSVTITPI